MKRRSRSYPTILGAAALTALALLRPTAAHAGDAQIYMPAADPNGYFSVWSADRARKGQFFASLGYNFADDPLEVGGLPLLNAIHTVDVIVSGAILDGVELGLVIPVSDPASEIGFVDGSRGVDDVHAFGKLSLLDTDAIRIAAIPFFDLPTGKEARLVSNEAWDFGGRLAIDTVGTTTRAGLNLGYRVNDTGDDDILFGVGVGRLVASQLDMLGGCLDAIEVLGEVYGHTSVDDPFDEFLTPFEVLGGMKFYDDEGWAMTLGGGAAPTDSLGGADFRVLAQFAWAHFPPPPLPAPPPPPIAPSAGVVITDEQIVPLEPIFFAFDSARIRPESRPALASVAKVLRDRPDTRLRIEGHTDSFGNDRYNRDLSQARAESIRRHLSGVEQIEGSRLESVGFGETLPVASNDTAEGRARNRRIEFHLLTPPRAPQPETHAAARVGTTEVITPPRPTTLD